MGAIGARAVPGLSLPPGLPSPLAGCGPTAGGATLPRQPGTPKGVKDDMLDETFIDVIPPLPLSYFYPLIAACSSQHWLKRCLTVLLHKNCIGRGISTTDIHSACTDYKCVGFYVCVGCYMSGSNGFLSQRCLAICCPALPCLALPCLALQASVLNDQNVVGASGSGCCVLCSLPCPVLLYKSLF